MMKPQFLGVMLLISFFCGNLKEIYSLRMAILPQKITDHLGNTVNLDSQTPLDQLVKKLDSDWQFKLIDQAPQIGYPDLMYSIGVYRGRALPLLVNFARTNPSRHAKYGAVLSIHLIGIELKSNHEGKEKFINPQARKALIDLLSEPELQIQILQLLIRDPWPLDIPYLFKYLKTDTPHAWGFVKALQAYNLYQRPVHQELPAPLDALECSPCKDSFPDVKDEYQVYRLLTICALQQAAGNKFRVEEGLLKNSVDGDIRSMGCLGLPKGKFEFLLDYLTTHFGVALGSKLEYFVEDGVVILCSMETARTRWLDWYHHKSQLMSKPKQEKH